MNREEIALLLARIAQFDGRRVEAATIEAWHGLFAPTGIGYPAAVAATEAYYRTETHRIMPGEIIRRAAPFYGTAWFTTPAIEQ